MKKKDPKEDFQDRIFNAFANPIFNDAQQDKIFWAIKEGYNRVPKLRMEYDIRTSRKEHTCARGCEIKAGSQYFASRSAWGSMKLCAGCMAMILYYLEVWDLPIDRYDYWDSENNRAHWAEDKV
jgi:hypothetical protein